MRHHPGYFRFLGTVEAIIFAFGLVLWIIVGFSSYGVLTGILVLIAIILFGPGMAALLFSHASALDDLNEIYKEKEESKIFALGEKVVFNKDVVVSDTDNRIIKKDSVGTVSSISGAYAIISVEFNGELITTKQLITFISKYKKK